MSGKKKDLFDTLEFEEVLKALADAYEEEFPGGGIQGPLTIQMDKGEELTWDGEE